MFLISPQEGGLVCSLSHAAMCARWRMDVSWEMCQAISSLCKRHRVHFPRPDAQPTACLGCRVYHRHVCAHHWPEQRYAEWLYLVFLKNFDQVQLTHGEHIFKEHSLTSFDISVRVKKPPPKSTQRTYPSPRSFFVPVGNPPRVASDLLAVSAD